MALIKPIQAGMPARGWVVQIVMFNGAAYFAANDGVTGRELWKSDGATVTQVADIYPGAADSNPDWMTVFSGRLYFVASDPLHGRELWKTDGTTLGTMLVGDIYTSTADSSPANLTVANGKLFFTANDGQF
jgi:ELWxxDGT repeat protein